MLLTANRASCSVAINIADLGMNFNVPLAGTERFSVEPNGDLLAKTMYIFGYSSNGLSNQK